ncbi:hypothetical protein CHS0354_007729 [Potamilus streckersoni]|uniref:Uncharacterized protein n=1 Tax=Potamilus streckersoni TaxID=2493646 RepID=A0AAE0VXD9_9BIVA|nr:hypothetical protein CHS0354_007729 [Potamilus streckersoni]
MRSKGRISRRDKHEKNKARNSVTEENVERVEEKRDVARMDKLEEENAMTSNLKSVEQADEGFPADLDVDAIPEKKASSNFMSEVNTINESGVQDEKSRKAMSKTQLEQENEDKEVTSIRHRSEKEINSGKDEEQTLEDAKGPIMEIISRKDGNENKDRENGEPSKRRESRKEIEDAEKSLDGNEAKLQVKNNVEVLSDQVSPVVSKQKEPGVADIHEEEGKETRCKIKKKLNCTNVDQELKKLLQDEAYALVHDVIKRVMTDTKLMSELNPNKSSVSVEVPSDGKAVYERSTYGANDAEVKGDQARKESLEAVPGHDPTLEIKSEEGDLGKQNEKAADKPSEFSSIDVIHLSNETLSMTTGLGAVPVKVVDASPTIKRRKSVTFNTNITKIHLFAPDDEEYSSYQEKTPLRKFPGWQDDFVKNSSSSMKDSPPVEKLSSDTSHRKTLSHLADSETVLQPVNTATRKPDINYQAILEITQKFVSLLNENDLKRAKSVVSKAVKPVNKDEGLHKNKLDMVFQEDEKDKKGYEYEEEKEEEENISPVHKGPSKYPGDGNLNMRGSDVGQDDGHHATIPSGHSDPICPKEQENFEMTTGQPGSIQAESSVQYPISSKSREPCDGTVPDRNTTLPLDYVRDDQLGMYHGSTSLEEEAQQRETDEGQNGRELWKTNLPPPLPKPDLLAPNPFPRRGNSLPVVRGPPSQTSMQATTISSHGRIKGKSNSLSKTPISDIHDLAKESARIPTTMPSISRPFDPIQGRKLGEAHDVLFLPPSLPKPPLKNNFKEILAPINGRSPSPVLHDVLLRGNVPRSYPIPKPPPLPRQAWSERNVIYGVKSGAWGIDSRTMTPHEEEPYIHYPHPPTTPGPTIHQPHPPSTPITSASSSSHLRKRYKLRDPNVPRFND